MENENENENENTTGIIKGIWLPGEVAFNEKLTRVDLFIWWIINSLDHTENNCWASNAYIAKVLKLNNKQTVTNSISKLKKLGYLKQISFDGRIRRLSINDSYLKKYKKLIKEYNKRLNPKINPKIKNELTIEELNSISYKEYLKTNHWKRVRKLAFKRAKYKCEQCEQCGNKGVLHPHHKTYKNRGNEHNNLDDIIVLCEDCHSKIHDKKEINK